MENKQMPLSPAQLKAKTAKTFKFGTFSGVFVPSVLAIFGAVMYLILPKVLGGVGLLKMLAIIFIAHSVSICTAFSLSSIATNIKVKGGGLYYLISRSLGSEFGGGLGVQLFLAQTVGTSFYSIAFARGVNAILGLFGIYFTEVSVAFFACLIFGIIVWFGAKFVIKLQYFILAAIIISLVVVFMAPTGGTAPALLGEGFPFWVGFALFFPAVTGIDAGVGMSGDLKDPKKSLVKGPFIAILVTMVVYIALAVKLAFSVPADQLFSNPMIIEQAALIPEFVLAGILLATASSALSYFMAGPRTLRALAQDNIFGSKTKFLGRSIGDSTEPRVALLVSLGIALIVIMSGDLDFVSTMVTIFFLNVYGWINGAAFFEKISRNPSFRPSFNSPAVISFLGMAISYFVMGLFNPIVMLVSVLFQISVFYVLYKTKTSIKLESVWDGVLFQLLRGVVSNIEKTARSKKNWRPTIVAFCADDPHRNLMFSLLDWIGSHSGIMKFYYLIEGNVEQTTKVRQMVEDDMKKYIKENGLDLFPRVIEAPNYRLAVETVLQSETIGNLPPNTALIHYDERFNLENLIQLTIRLKKNVIILYNRAGFSDFKYIDVWWDDPDNGNLMILLAYLISHSQTWLRKDASIRLFKVARNEQEYEFFKSKLNKLINESRIDNMTLNMLVEPRKQMSRIIKENSQYADLVLMGIPHVKSKGVSSDLEKDIREYTEGLSTTLIVQANDKIDFRIN